MHWMRTMLGKWHGRCGEKTWNVSEKKNGKHITLANKQTSEHRRTQPAHIVCFLYQWLWIACFGKQQIKRHFVRLCCVATFSALPMVMATTLLCEMKPPFLWNGQSVLLFEQLLLLLYQSQRHFAREKNAHSKESFMRKINVSIYMSSTSASACMCAVFCGFACFTSQMQSPNGAASNGRQKKHSPA